jgi:hypothetical protein
LGFRCSPVSHIYFAADFKFYLIFATSIFRRFFMISLLPFIFIADMPLSVISIDLLELRRSYRLLSEILFHFILFYYLFS